MRTECEHMAWVALCVCVNGDGGLFLLFLLLRSAAGGWEGGGGCGLVVLCVCVCVRTAPILHIGAALSPIAAARCRYVPPAQRSSPVYAPLCVPYLYTSKKAVCTPAKFAQAYLVILPTITLRRLFAHTQRSTLLSLHFTSHRRIVRRCPATPCLRCVDLYGILASLLRF